MRILAIRGQNLASLARSFEVDLARGPLAGVGLFAITGPVGAGKSTLLDALCLPLFDRTPRLSGRGGLPVVDEGEQPGDWLRSNDPRTLLRRDAAEGFAEVDFVGRDGVRYRARWFVRRARRRPDGRVQEQELSLVDLDQGIVVAGGRKTEVLAAVHARLGLDFDQFCRSVLLAQGDFAAFLRASPDDRARLLENLTGADVYRRLSQAAHERRRRLQADIDVLAAQANAAVLLGEAQREQLQRHVQQRTHELRIGQLAVDLAQGYVSWYRSAAELRQQESDATVRLQAAQRAQAEAAPRRERQQRLVRALPVVPRAEQVLERQRRLVEATGIGAAAREALAQAQAASQRSRTALQRALEQGLLLAAGAPVPPVVAEFRRWRTALERWSHARGRQRQCAASLAGQQVLATTAAAAVSPLQHAVDLAEAAQARAAARLAGAEAAARAPDLAAMGRQRRALAAERALLRDLGERQRDWGRREAELAAAVQLVAHRTQARDGLASGFVELVEAREAAERQLLAVRAKRDHLQAQLDVAALREHLVAGEPCPLCGSVDHPAPATGDAALLQSAATAVAAAERAFDAAREAVLAREAQRRAAERALAEGVVVVAQAEAAAAAARAAWATAAGDLAEADLATAGQQLAAREEQLAAREASLEQEADAYEALQRAVAAARDEERGAVEACQRQREALQRAIAAAADAQRAAQAAADEQRRWDEAARDGAQELEPACAGIPAWQERLEAFGGQAASRLAALSDQELQCRTADALAGSAAAREAEAAAAVQRAEAELCRANAAFEAALAQTGVRAVEVREAAELGAEALAAEAEQLRELDLAVERARAVVQKCAELRRRHESVDRPEIDEADAAQALEDARASRQRIAEQLEGQRAELAADDLLRRQRDELAPRLLAAEQAMEVWAALDDLIGSSHGDAFVVFAQELTLDLLLGEANRRLGELARRYQLHKNPGGPMDFVVVDLDLGGTRRSLQTLSGGETFLVSLALALALATLAAPRSRVETLFLDEGFGTLDAQHLEVALGALDTLQASGCQVGVISHVDGIAERIGAVVEVRPEGGGQSRVVARVR